MFVFSNLAMSIDGKIATATREHFPLGTVEDRKMMHVLRRKAEVVIMGASTIRAFRRPCIVQPIPGQPAVRRQPLNAIVSSALEGLDPTWPFFTANAKRPILFVGKETSAKRVDLFKQVADVVRLGRRDQLARDIVRALAKRGVRNLLVEGGGGLMWDFVAHNLIDEFYITLTPKVLGGAAAPTLIDGAGFTKEKVLSLKLKGVKRVKDELFLVYKREL